MRCVCVCVCVCELRGCAARCYAVSGVRRRVAAQRTSAMTMVRRAPIVLSLPLCPGSFPNVSWVLPGRGLRAPQEVVRESRYHLPVRYGDCCRGGCCAMRGFSDSVAVVLVGVVCDGCCDNACPSYPACVWWLLYSAIRWLWCLRVWWCLLRQFTHEHCELNLAFRAAGENDTCGIRAHAGRPHRLSRPTP